MKHTFHNIKTDFANNKPKRIISLVPSITQYLYDLDLSEKIVGITLFCEKRNNCDRIGGTKKLDIEKIKSLKPDLILANKEENVKEQIEELSKYFPVWVSDINTLDDSFNMMLEIGEILGETEKSIKMVTEIQKRFQKFKQNKNSFKPRVVYFIWNNPMMVAAKNTFINSMINDAGFVNIFENLERYPEVLVEEINNFKPEILLLSSEPFPFSIKHKKEFEMFFPDTKVILCDGKMFSWYGSQLLESPHYFEQLRKEIFEQ